MDNKEKLVSMMASTPLRSTNDVLLGPVVDFSRYLQVPAEDEESIAASVAAKIMQLQDRQIREEVAKHGIGKAPIHICTAWSPDDVPNQEAYDTIFLAPKGSPAEAYAKMSQEAYKSGGSWSEKDAEDAVRKCGLHIAPVLYMVPKWMGMVCRLEKMLREYKM